MLRQFLFLCERRMQIESSINQTLPTHQPFHLSLLSTPLRRHLDCSVFQRCDLPDTLCFRFYFSVSLSNWTAFLFIYILISVTLPKKKKKFTQFPPLLLGYHFIWFTSIYIYESPYVYLIMFLIDVNLCLQLKSRFICINSFITWSFGAGQHVNLRVQAVFQYYPCWHKLYLYSEFQRKTNVSRKKLELLLWIGSNFRCLRCNSIMLFSIYNKSQNYFHFVSADILIQCAINHSLQHPSNCKHECIFHLELYVISNIVGDGICLPYIFVLFALINIW